MTECQKCRGRAQLYLCPNCIVWLRRQLLSLPTLISHLQDSSLGLTRLSNENSRQLGFESRTPTLNGRAARLIQDIDNVVGGWARGTARIHGLMISPPVTWHRPWDIYKYTTSDFAIFLAANTDKLARDPDIGELCASLGRFIRQAVGDEDRDGIMDRRTPAQFCGPCPATIIDHRHCVTDDGRPCSRRDHECATQLMARRGAVEVTCPVCGSQHRVEALVNSLLAHADDHRFTIPDLHRVLRMLNEPVKMDTLYRWATPKMGRLVPAGYQRSDGRRIGVTRESDKDTPVYRVSDARKQREESAKPGRRGRPLKSEGKK